MNEIETAFQKMESWYRARTRNRSATGKETVLQYMLDHPEKIWFWSWEFIGQVNSRGGFLSHRSPARASDLAIHHPDLVEDRRIGRFSVYRLKRENIDQVRQFLS